MSTRERLKEYKNKGYSIKLISQLSEISLNTLYSFSSGKRELSPEKEDKLNKVLDTLK